MTRKASRERRLIIRSIQINFTNNKPVLLDINKVMVVDIVTGKPIFEPVLINKESKE